MAITTTSKGDAVLMPDAGQIGFHHLKLTLDGTTPNVTVTMPTSSGIKTILGVLGASATLPLGGQPSTTALPLKFPAGTAADNLDVFVFGRGR